MIINRPCMLIWTIYDHVHRRALIINGLYMIKYGPYMINIYGTYMIIYVPYMIKYCPYMNVHGPCIIITRLGGKDHGGGEMGEGNGGMEEREEREGG